MWPSSEIIALALAGMYRRAYQHGFRTGIRNLPWDPLDWEEEFRDEYRRGRAEGIAARARGERE